MSNPRQYKIPDWFLNRQKELKDGKYSQIVANNLETKLREDLERLKKIGAHRGLRHYWKLRIPGDSGVELAELWEAVEEFDDPTLPQGMKLREFTRNIFRQTGVAMPKALKSALDKDEV